MARALFLHFAMPLALPMLWAGGLPWDGQVGALAWELLWGTGYSGGMELAGGHPGLPVARLPHCFFYYEQPGSLAHPPPVTVSAGPAQY